MITLPADLPAHLAKALTNPPPHPEGEQERNAAVLLPLYEKDGEWFVLFTRRTHLVLTHRGQVSFPGGMADPGDHSPLQTALREAEEELGLPSSGHHYSGRPAPDPHNNRCLRHTHRRPDRVAHPPPPQSQGGGARIWSSRCAGWPTGRIEPHTPAEWKIRYQVEDVIVYEPYDGEVVWGATARMLKSLIDRLPVSSP